MKKNNFINIIFLLIILPGLFIGCCASHTRVKGLSPSAYPLYEKPYEELETTETLSSSFHLLWFIPVTSQADYKKAIDEAINDKGGDNLINVRYWHERQYWLVGRIDILHVRGKVIRYIE